MRNQTTQNTKTVSRVYVLIFAGFITIGLFLLKQFDIFHLEFEVVFAPFIAITLLAYGEELIILLLLSIGFIINLFRRLNSKFNLKNNKQL